MVAVPSALAHHVLALVPGVTDPSVPPSTDAPPAGAESAADGNGFVSSVGEVIRTMIDNLGNNGYQTGVALVVATIAVVAMLNIKAHKAVLVPVGIGAFWAGWLGWNTVTGDQNPLFPGDVSATKIWDVAFAGETGFLLAVIVACVAAVFLWRRGTALTGRVVMIVGAVLGASFVYNLVEAIRFA